MFVTCPNCGQPVVKDQNCVGLAVDCPKCGVPMVITVSGRVRGLTANTAQRDAWLFGSIIAVSLGVLGMILK